MMRTVGSPTSAVMHYPIEESFLEADVVAGFFALYPLVAKDFLTLRNKLAIQHGVLNEGFPLAMGVLHR